MDIDPAPFLKNLFWYTDEQDYIKNLIKEDRVKAEHFHSDKLLKRLIDLVDFAFKGRNTTTVVLIPTVHPIGIEKSRRNVLLKVL